MIELAADLSRWVREGPFAAAVPWRIHQALERWTAARGYRGSGAPLQFSLRQEAAQARLLFGGDVALHRWQGAAGLEPFRRLSETMLAADFRVVNLETQLTRTDLPAGTIGTSLRAEPAAGEVLSYLGVDAVNCANNHCLDYGPDALAESAEHLRSRGIAVIGLAAPDAEPLAREVRGVRLGLLGFTDDWRYVGPPSDRAWPAAHEEAGVRARIAAAKPRCDVLAVQLHWGYEWSMYPMRTYRDLARSYVNAGADIVVCHHAHVPMGIEVWERGIVAHGLGNLYFGPSRRAGHPFERTSVLLAVRVSRAGVIGAEVLPVVSDPDGTVGPAPDSAGQAVQRAIRLISMRLSSRQPDAVEEWHIQHAGWRTVLSLVQREAAGDARSVLERLHHLHPPRQRWMINRLREETGPVLRVGRLLGELSDGHHQSLPPTLAAELRGLTSTGERWIARHRQKGRIP